jgi:hypothetical protein
MSSRWTGGEPPNVYVASSNGPDRPVQPARRTQVAVAKMTLYMG